VASGPSSVNAFNPREAVRLPCSSSALPDLEYDI
jgi:hypothetical protein